MSSPRVQALDGPAPSAAGTGGIVPVYPLTENLRADQLRPLLRRALDLHGRHVAEPLPAALRQQHRFPDAAQAPHHLPFPASLAAADAARCRFVYEELLLLQLGLALRRRGLRDRERAPVLPVTPAIDARIRRLFPFALTADQDRAVADVCRDLAQ